MQPIECKVCLMPSIKPVFEKKLTRPEFLNKKLPFYRCDRCGFIFTNGLDDLNREDMQKFYAYPEYLKYDPGAVSQRRKERTKALIKHVEKKFGMKNPKILHHGNGNCESAKELLAEGYDVWTTYDHLENWDRSVDPHKAKDFDIVCSIEVIEHWVRPSRELGEVHKMLKSGGVFCGTTCLSDGVDIKHMIDDSWHYTKQHVMNAGHCSIWSARALDELSWLYWENHTEHGDNKLREVSHMPSTSVFFQFKKK